MGIVGPTGSGKSTVVSMISRFYDPTRGTVRIDGRDVRDFKLTSLRQQIGYVLQDTILFRGSIAENIAFGRPNASRQEIIAAAELANAYEFISKMAQDYDTMVGERALRCRAGSGNASESPVSWSATTRSCCSIAYCCPRQSIGETCN